MKLFRLLALGLLVLVGTANAAAPSPIAWEKWSDDVFARAERENRFVLLDLEAVWCHWCHVMDEITYHDPRVVELIRKHYIPVRVDQDSRPDISKRYEDYGWPATVVFNAQGGEIVKRRGYLPPPGMIAMLEEIIVDPSPIRYRDNEPIAAYAKDALLSDAVRTPLERAFRETHDPVLGGSRQEQKFIDPAAADYGLLRASLGDAEAEAMTRRTLSGALKLIDPAWGGAYQYSTDGDWDHAHFEKIMSVQSDYLRIYALGYRQFGDTRYLEAARSIHSYVDRFLRSPEGGYYTSQDADLVKGEHSGEYFALADAARMKLGVPAIDKHRYARENGWMTEALAIAYGATGEKSFLDDALAAAKWVIAHRSLADGGFRHDEVDSAGPYLEDSLAMGRAFLALYAVTADRTWLDRARTSAAFIDKQFRSKDAGYTSSALRAGAKLAPKANIEENVSMTHFANLLHRYTGHAGYRAMTEHAMRYLATPDVAGLRITAPGILLADFVSSHDPVHLTIVGHKDDAQAASLFAAAVAQPHPYKRTEWWDKREGAMPNPDVQYPQLAKPAAFVCTDSTCSLPIFAAADIPKELRRAARTIP